MSDQPPHGLVADADLFRALFETAPDAMIVIDRSGTIVLVNPQAERLFGYADGALTGRPIETLMPAAVRKAHVAHRTHYMDSPRVRPMGAGYELTGLRADGQAFPVEIGLSPVAALGGTLFAASIRDISETQRARQALVRARYDACVAQVGRRVLETAHNEQVFDEIPTLIATTLDIPAVAVLLVAPHRAGLNVQSSVGFPAPLLDALNDDRLATAMASHASVDAEPADTAIDWLGNGYLPLADTGFADAAVAPLLDRRAPMGYLLALARERGHFDRDRRHLLQSLANILAAAIQRGRSEEQLAHAQRLDALGQLTGGIAHDFNNLLTVISGNLQLLEAEATPDPAVRETIESAARAVERGATLTRKLLAFSRRQHLRPRAISSVQLLADLRDMLGRTLGERIPVRAECLNDVPEVYADPGELEAALINLALNARDAMPRGGRLAITARAHRIETADDATGLPTGNYVVFTVSDTGMGMPPEVLARALEPFFTTKESGKGSGLGLSMVYGFVKQSGGHLNIQSQLGYGTRVELHLPCASVAVRTASRPGVPTSQRGHECVLVVEDEAEVRRIAVAFLHSLGYATHEAPDAATALALLATHPGINLLFSDIVLGNGMTGFELAAKAHERHPELSVLFTSGYEHASMDVDDAAIGAFDLLRKPYRREQLALALRQVLDRA
jgi:PAS domain S-box-containing protein